jgi:hypothetical protein
MWFFKNSVLDNDSGSELSNSAASISISGNRDSISERQDRLDDIEQNVNCEI